MKEELLQKIRRSAYEYAEYHVSDREEVTEFTKVQHQQLIELTVLECIKAIQADKKQTKQIALHFGLDWA